MGCHSIAVCWHVLTPHGKPMSVMEPISVNADVALLKWGQKKWREDLKVRMGVDYEQMPAEDFATGLVTFRNRETGQVVKGQFTVSWMYEKQGLRLFVDGIGPGYAFEVNTLQSPLNIFIGDAAAEAVADAESALEKATASRGLLAVQPNEADLYGYVGEWEDLRDALRTGRPCLADWNYGLEITKLCQAAYLSAERGVRIDLTDPEIQKELETFHSLIALGKGEDLLY
jgi:predicted dehydrogenase